MKDSTDTRNELIPVETPPALEGEIILSQKENPFEDGVIHKIVASGKNLIDTIDESDLRFAPGFEYAVYVNDTLIPVEEYETFFPPANSIIVIYTVMKGGRGGKILLRAIAMIAVAAFAFLALPALLPAFALAHPYIMFAMSCGVNMLGTMLVDKLIPLPEEESEAITTPDIETSQRYAIENASNKTNNWGTIPIVLGTHRLFPPLLTPTQIELVNEKSYAKLLLCLGYGTIKITQTSGYDDIFLEDSNIENFNVGDEVNYVFYPKYVPGTKIAYFEEGQVQISNGNAIKKPSLGYIVLTTIDGTKKSSITIGTKSTYAIDQTMHLSVEWKDRLATSWNNIFGGKVVPSKNFSFGSYGTFDSDIFVVYINTRPYSPDNYWIDPYTGEVVPIPDTSYTIEAFTIPGGSLIYPRDSRGYGDWPMFPPDYDISSQAYLNEIGMVLACENNYGVTKNGGAGVYAKNGTSDYYVGLYLCRTGAEYDAASGTYKFVIKNLIDLRNKTWSHTGFTPAHNGQGRFDQGKLISPGNDFPCTIDYTNFTLNITGASLRGFLSITFNAKNLFERTFEIPVTGNAAGQYDVRVSFSEDLPAPDLPIYVKYLTCEKTIGSYCLEENLSLLSMKFLSSQAFNSSLDNVNLIASRLCISYNETSDTFEPAYSSNCADILLEVLTGIGNKRAATLDEIDLPAIKSWHRFCTINNYTYNAVIDQPTSVYEIAKQICNAGRAAFTQKNGKYSVIIDKYNNIPVQMFTPRNTWGFSAKKSYYDDIHGLRVSIINADNNWKTTEIIIYANGYNEANAVYLEDLKLEGITNAEQANKIALYHLNQLRLRNETFTFSTDIEHIVCTRGDRIILQYDVPLIGICSGRLSDITKDTNNNILTFSVDEICSMETGKSYIIKVRNSANEIKVFPVVCAAGEQKTLTLTTPTLSEDIKSGDLFLFGQSGFESIDLIVNTITPGKDLTAELVCCQYVPELYASALENISLTNANFTVNSNIIEVTNNPLADGVKFTLLPGEQAFQNIADSIAIYGNFAPYPLKFNSTYYVVNSTATNFQLSETRGGAAITIEKLGVGTYFGKVPVSITPDVIINPTAKPVPIFNYLKSNGEAVVYDAVGNPTYNIIAAFECSNANTINSVDHIVLSWKKTSDTSMNATTSISLPANSTLFKISNVDKGQNYTITAKYIYAIGTSSQVTTATHTVIGDDGDPLVATFNDDLSKFEGSTITIAMNTITSKRFSFFEIRKVDANWGVADSNLVFKGSNSIYSFDPSTFVAVYYLKACTTTGIYSTTADTITITPENLSITFFRNSFYLSSCIFSWDTPSKIVDYYKIAIYSDAAFSSLIHEYTGIKSNNFTFTKEDNNLYTMGNPKRELWCILTLVDLYGRSITATTTAINDIPPTVGVLTLTPETQAIKVTFDDSIFKVSGYIPMANSDNTIYETSDGFEYGIQWTSETSSAIDYFEIFCDTSTNPTTLVGTSTKGIFTIPNLLPSTLYRVKVRAVDNFGPAEFSNIFSITTPAA